MSRHEMWWAAAAAAVLSSCGQPVVSLEFSGEPLQLTVGDRMPLEVVARGEGGEAIHKPQLTFVSRNTRVAFVDPEGRVTASSPGIARITARSGRVEAVTEVRVIPYLAQDLALDEDIDGQDEEMELDSDEEDIDEQLDEPGTLSPTPMEDDREQEPAFEDFELYE